MSGAGIRILISLLIVAGLASLIMFRLHRHGASAPLDRAESPAANAANPAVVDQARRLRVSDAYGRLPLSFERNLGQASEPVKFLSRGNGYGLFLTSTETVLTSTETVVALRKPGSGKSNHSTSKVENRTPAVLRMKMIGANPAARIEGLNELPGKTNYLIGNDPQKWRTDVPNYQTVHYREIYPGIDVKYYGNERQLEYDFVVAPYASTRVIKMLFAGARRVRIDHGDLVIKARGAEIRQLKPFVYQEVDGVRREISARYVLLRKSGQSGRARNTRVGFAIAKYDRSLPLVIDPTLVYSSYLGGSDGNEEGRAIAVDALGNAYVAGIAGYDFPTTPGAYQTTNAATFGLGAQSGFVTKIDPTGTTKIYSTYLGGGCPDKIFGIAVNSAGEAHVTGASGSGINPQSGTPDCEVPEDLPFNVFPQVNAFSSYGGGYDAFLTKLNADGNGLVYSSFLGGSQPDRGFAIALDSGGNAYVTGETNSADFPTSSSNGSLPASFQANHAGGFSDAFVTKVGSLGGLLYSTYFGGGGYDYGRGIAVGAQNVVHITGMTTSGSLVDGCNPDTNQPELPTTSGALQNHIAPSQPCVNCCDGSPGYVPNYADAFVAKLKLNQGAIDPQDPVLVYSTYLGGGTLGDINADAGDEAHAIALDGAGGVYVTGYTSASDFPTRNPYQSTLHSGNPYPYDAFVTKLNMNGSGANDLVYSTYLGGDQTDEGNGIAVNSGGEAFVAGFGNPPAVNALANGGAGVTFVTRFSANGQSVNYSTTMPGASYIWALALGSGVNNNSSVYITGIAQTGLQTTPGVFQPNYAGSEEMPDDAFVAQIGDQITPTCVPSQVCRPSVGGCDTAEICNPDGTCPADSQLPNGTSCDDGNACTTDTCQAGACVSTAIDCSALDSACSVGACDPGTGTCSAQPAREGLACDDGSGCTRVDKCQAGSCVGADEVVCTGDQCHDAGTCDPQTGACSTPPKASGTVCNDGNGCTRTDTCQAGVCVGDDEVICTGDQCHEAGTCDPQTGACPTPPKADGSPCSDGNGCTRTDTCQAGVCVGDDEVICTGDQCHDAGACDPQTGVCPTPPKADGTACNDGDACTRTDTCQSGSCVGDDEIVCTAPDQCHGAGACDPQTGVCPTPPKTDGTPCDDGNACTSSDSCQSGTCTSGTPKVCTASDQCHDVGTCDPQTGNCSTPPKVDGAACNDLNACTLSDSCQSGSCTAGAAKVCTASDQCHDAGTCNPFSGACSNPAKANGTTCNDGNGCTTDSCQSGTCNGIPVVCAASDQCHTAGSCNPSTGACSNPLKPNGTACDDGNRCTPGDSCQTGTCAAGPAIVCTASDQCHDVGTCNSTTGACSNPAKSNGTSCNDGNACTSGDSCQTGSCSGTTVCTSATQTGFVIGDRNATVGSRVTFWGSQWASKNSLSGGSAPSSFKGFAYSNPLNPPSCGSSWRTDSSNPPATVPQYIVVLVSSSVAKSGSVFSGNTRQMVVVRTDAGYADNPGHAGTGTVVSVSCQTTTAELSSPSLKGQFWLELYSIVPNAIGSWLGA